MGFLRAGKRALWRGNGAKLDIMAVIFNLSEALKPTAGAGLRALSVSHLSVGVAFSGVQPGAKRKNGWRQGSASGGVNKMALGHQHQILYRPTHLLSPETAESTLLLRYELHHSSLQNAPLAE